MEKSDDTCSSFVASRAPLLVGNAVAAIVLLQDGRYLLQHRDDLPHIWYPNHWGCFGGSVEPGEDPVKALHRELKEELAIEFHEANYFVQIDFNLAGLGLGPYYRKYYVVCISPAEMAGVRLREGKAVMAFDSDTIFKTLTVTPYDAFALFLHARSFRIESVK